ncbi:MAG: hypothetical protein R3F33_03395 [Planctomycetota bacterium]
MTPQSAHPAASRPALRLLLVAIGAVLLLTYVPLTRVQGAPVGYSRLADGSWSVRGADLRSWRGLHAVWARGGTEYQHVSWPARIDAPQPARRIWVVQLSPDPVAGALADAITQDLLADPELEEVGFFPYATLPLKEFRCPDLWIKVAAMQGESRTWPGRFRAKGRIEVRLEPWLLPAPQELGETPVHVEQWSYDSERTGLVSAAGRWQTLAADLLEKAELRQTLSTWRGDAEGALADLPPTWLHGATEGLEIPGLLDEGERLHLLNRGQRWLVPEVTGWIVDGQSDSFAGAKALAGRLQAAGWQPCVSHPGGFTLEHGELRLDIRPLWGSPSALETVPALQQNGDTRPLGVLVVHPFRPEQALAWFDQLKASELSEAEWHSLVAHLTHKQRRLLSQYLVGLTDEMRAGHDAGLLATLRKELDDGSR